MISEETSQKIRNMSLCCAVLVVFIHIVWPADHKLSLGWLKQELVATGISAISVPIFFVFSGFFLAHHIGEDSWWIREIRKRIRSLVVPFYFWNFSFFIVTNLLPLISDLLANRPIGTNHAECVNWWRLLGIDLVHSPLNYPLWYVRCLFFLVLLSPIINYVITRFGFCWLLLTACLWFLHDYIPNVDVRDFFFKSFSFVGVFFFSIGMWIKKQSTVQLVKCVHPWGGGMCVIFGVSLLVVKCILAYNEWPMYTCVSKLSVILLAYGIWYFMPTFRIPDWLTNCSFPIYVAHAILLVTSGCLFRHIPLHGVSRGILVISYSILGSIAVTLLLRHLSPRFASLIFGGR